MHCYSSHFHTYSPAATVHVATDCHWSLVNGYAGKGFGCIVFFLKFYSKEETIQGKFNSLQLLQTERQQWKITKEEMDRKLATLEKHNVDLVHCNSGT